MPWKRTWVPNPKDESIEVFKQLPERFEEQKGWGEIAHAFIPVKLLIEDKANGKPIDARILYHCAQCEGWIEGRPYEYREDNIGHLCGRRGTVSCCKRCGTEMGFSGMVS